MFTRVTGAALRAVLMALLVLMPSLLLPNVSADTSQITVLVALLAFLMTFIEYYSQYPSIVEFRYASPFNRLRFLALFVSVTLLSVILASTSGSGGMAGVLHKIGTAWGGALDFPFSPVRLMVLMMPEQASEQLITSVRISAGIAYMISLVTLLVFVTMVRLLGWPTRNRPGTRWARFWVIRPVPNSLVVQLRPSISRRSLPRALVQFQRRCRQIRLSRMSIA